MNRVLVTGATGFIGQHALSSLLTAGYEVHSLSSQMINGWQTGVIGHQVDIFNSEQVWKLLFDIRPTHLLHFAWFVTHGAYWNSPDNIRWVQASLDLLRAFAQNGGHRVLMAGTCAEYDWTYRHCSEQITPLLPATLYGTSKHALHIMLEAFSKQIGLSYAWGRIFFLYGPHESPERLVSSVIRSLLKGDVARCSHGKQIRDFMYVQDAADAFVALLESEFTGPFNIASGQPISLRELVQEIGTKLGRPDLIQLGARPAPVGEPDVLTADVDRIVNEVGWTPKHNLDQGLDLTIQWWADHLKVG